MTEDTEGMVKIIWRKMLSVDSIPQKDLVLFLVKQSGKSKTACFYILKHLCAPVQLGWRVDGGKVFVDFVKEPLLIQVPSADRLTHYSLHEYWKDFVKSDSEIFEKTKRFY